MVEKTMSCGAHFNQKTGASDPCAFFPRAGGVDDGYDMDDDHDDDDEDRQPRRQPRTNKQKETKNGALKKDIGEELREKQEKNKKKQTRCDSKQKWTSVRSSPAP